MNADQHEALVRRIVRAVSATDFRGSTGDVRWSSERYQQLKSEPSRDRSGCSCDFEEALRRAREEWLRAVLDSAPPSCCAECETGPDAEVRP